MRNSPITITGGGIAALSCARILTSLGQAVVVSAARLPAGRSVALNGAAIFLLKRIWGDDLIRDAAKHSLVRRILAWEGIDAITIDEQSQVADIAELALHMRHKLECEPLVVWGDEPAESDIVAQSRDQDRCVRGGERKAIQAPIILRKSADVLALRVEAVSHGWLVTMPIGGREAVLMGVTLGDERAGLEWLIEQSCGTQELIAELGLPSLPVDAAPSLFVSSAIAPHAMRIGEAAMRFDPISGDGVAGALRGAHLCALLFDRRARGETGMHAVYEQRLAQAMRAHLGGLAQIYGKAPLAENWRRELQRMQWMDQEICTLRPLDDARVAITERALTKI